MRKVQGTGRIDVCRSVRQVLDNDLDWFGNTTDGFKNVHQQSASSVQAFKCLTIISGTQFLTSPCSSCHLLFPLLPLNEGLDIQVSMKDKNRISKIN